MNKNGLTLSKLYHALPLLVYLVLLMSNIMTICSAQSYCNCQFSVLPEQEDGCRVYGQMGDGFLIPWYRANTTCIESLGNTVSFTLSREQLYKICPNSDSGTDANVQLLVNEIRINPGPATRAVQASLPQFFTESTTTAGVYELNDVIYDDRGNASPDCNTSSNACWSLVKDYFIFNPNEVDSVCTILHSHLSNNYNIEQSTTRIKLCNEGDEFTDDIITSCQPLYSQIVQYKTYNPDKLCSAFGIGPAEHASKIPSEDTCDLNASANDKSDAVTNTTTTTNLLRTIIVMMIGLSLF